MEPDREMETPEEGRVIVVVHDTDISPALALKALNFEVDHVMIGLSFSSLKPGDSVYATNLSIGQMQELRSMENIRIFKMFFNMRRNSKEREGPGQIYNMGQLSRKAVIKLKEIKEIDIVDTELKL